MHNYHTDLIWKIDLILLSVAFLFVLVIVLYAAIRGRVASKRQARLLNIKKRLYESLLPGTKKGASNIQLPEITTQDFLDIEINRLRDAIFFNENEQKILKKCFIESKNIDKLEKNARTSRNKWRRIESIIGLGYANQASALNTLEKALHDKDEDVVYFSIVALGQIKTLQSARILLSFLEKNIFSIHRIVSVLEDFPAEISNEVVLLTNNSNPNVRISGVRLIAKLKQENCDEKIESLSLDDESGEVRAAACECLGSFGKEKYTKTISKCLNDNFWMVRVKAVTALSKILGSKCIPKIIGLVRDNSWSVIETVKNTLAKHIEAALPYIEKLLYEGDSIAKRASVEALEGAGYITNILNDILLQKDKRKEQAIYLLKGIIKTKIHFSLALILESLDNNSRNKILEVLGQENKTFVEYIKRKTNGENGK